MADNTTFSNFTNKYALSKTLRFELKPIGKTLENMREHLEYDETLQTFLRDQRIEDAYQTLKPCMDALHEEFTTKSLRTRHANNIAFSEYVDKRKELLRHKEALKKKGYGKQAINDDKKVKNLEQGLDTAGEELRKKFEAAFSEAGEQWKRQYSKYEWKKGSSVAKGARVLSSPDTLKLISDIYENDSKVQAALQEFQGFFTYFSGFNKNRENYYETSKEASTAIATRTVHENLPRFTDNVVAFDARRNEYLEIFDFLKHKGKALVNKDEEELHPIPEDVFDHTHFARCLSQPDIEKYNTEVGNANFIINLYNQAKNREPGFKKLQSFKPLYKQIGCGRKDPLFFALTHEKKSEAEEARRKDENKKPFSVEEVLELAQKAGTTYFASREGDTVPAFINYLQSQDNYYGFYWPKTTLNTISGKYFANWHDLKDRLKAEKIFKKGGKNDVEDIKIPEVIELQGFFEVLDNTSNWKTTLFKTNLLKDTYKSDVIQNSTTAHEALLGMISQDITFHAQAFVDGWGDVEHLTQEYFELDPGKEKERRRKQWKEAIKAWMDHALAVNQMLKYFKVREDKTKGTPLDPTLSQSLDALLLAEDAQWFRWYDALRNFLTKKPQDYAQESKLKLNFENGSLLGGWSDGQEKSKSAVLLKKDGLYYLGILKKGNRNVFDTSKDNNHIYDDTTPNSGRLILANLSFKTLSGKGFKGEFGEKYSDMGKRNPQKAIECLQKIIKDRYKEYSLLERLAETKYTDKKQFDADIKGALNESYLCEFKDIDWRKVEHNTDLGNVYLFQIYSKDFASGRHGKQDLQSGYWESLFTNTETHQLNGGGEIFYRRQAIKERRIKVGFENKPWVIEKRRFTQEEGKFLFHCPLKLNYRAYDPQKPEYAFPYVNKYINATLPEAPGTLFLGIDRGEKHLGYYTLVDAQENIKAQGTLNMPFRDKDGNPRTVKVKKRFLDENGGEQEIEVDCKDYNELLDARAGDRNYARKNWQTIGSIKELKEGYISQVVHEITKLATNEPTFIILEDLNIGFMRGRQKIEKSVYKKLEVALLKKLNFVVDKHKDSKYDELGSVTKAIQLTPPTNNYDELKDKGKQAGAMLFVRPDFTSATDPVTGWRKKVYIGKGSEDAVRERITKLFDDIYFDGKDYVFVYTDSVTNKKWRIYSGKNGKGLDRYHRERGDHGEWVETLQDIPVILDGLFADFDKSRSLLEQIKAGSKPAKINEYTAWESLRFAIHLIQQIRNTGRTGDGRNADFILSPARDEDGEHFDSRHYLDREKAGENVDLPSSGDANGAYNIARKGIILNEHIKRGLKLYIRDEEWDAWLAGRETWEEWLKQNIDRLRKG